MDEIAQGRVLHLGTYNGNPLVMAGAKAVLRDICTPEATQATIDRNLRLLAATATASSPTPAWPPTRCSSARRAA